MTDCKKLELACQWAADIDADRETLSQDTIDAAADLISSLPDAWVSVDTLRKFVEDWREGLATAPRGNYEDEMLDDLEALLPAPPAPESAAPHPEDVPEFDPAYTYSDRIGNEWSYVIQAWRCFSTATGKLLDSHLPTPPAKFGPYTRIEDTK